MGSSPSTATDSKQATTTAATTTASHSNPNLAMLDDNELSNLRNIIKSSPSPDAVFAAFVNEFNLKHVTTATTKATSEASDAADHSSDDKTKAINAFQVLFNSANHEAFEENIAIIAKGTQSQTIRKLFDGVVAKSGFYDMFLLCFLTSLDSQDTTVAANKRDVVVDIQPLVNAVKEACEYHSVPSETVNYQFFRNNIVNETFTCLYGTLQEFILTKYLYNPPRQMKINLPGLTNESQILSHSTLFMICSSLGLWGNRNVDTNDGKPQAVSKWQRLFASFEQGISFDQLCVSIGGYSGPTLIVIRDTNNCEFGAFTRTGWRESNQYYGGNDEAVLFSLRPTFRVFRKQDSANAGNVQFLCMRSKNNIIPRGIGFGGDVLNTRSCRLWIDGEMENCIAGRDDLAFATGPLRGTSTMKEKFVPAVIEMWGLGGDSASAALKKEKEGKEQLIMDRRKVDKKQLLNQFDKEYLLTETFKHEGEKQTADR